MKPSKGNKTKSNNLQIAKDRKEKFENKQKSIKNECNKKILFQQESFIETDISDSTQSYQQQKSQKKKQIIQENQVNYSDKNSIKYSKGFFLIKRRQQKKIIQSGYPQNVMRRVYPIQNKKDYNQVLLKKPQKEENNLLVKPSKWNIDFCQEQSKNTLKSIPQFYQNRQKFENIEWVISEINLIDMNLRWIATVVLFEKFDLIKNQKFFEESQYINKVKVLSKKQIQQYLLQLKCLLRYRTITEILIVLQNRVRFFHQAKSLFGLCSKQQIETNLQLIECKNYEFSNQVMGKFINLLVTLANQYQMTSQSNKKYIIQLFEQKFQQKNNIVQTQPKLKNILQSQGLFEPFKNMINTKSQVNKEFNNQIFKPINFKTTNYSFDI